MYYLPIPCIAGASTEPPQVRPEVRRVVLDATPSAEASVTITMPTDPPLVPEYVLASPGALARLILDLGQPYHYRDISPRPLPESESMPSSMTSDEDEAAPPVLPNPGPGQAGRPILNRANFRAPDPSLHGFEFRPRPNGVLPGAATDSSS